MSRAVLVIDMPDSCMSCKIGRNSSCILEQSAYCPVTGQATIEEECESRPEWCPIRPMPEKENNDNLMDEYQDGYDDGWNSCIDAIGGGDNGTT